MINNRTITHAPYVRILLGVFLVILIISAAGIIALSKTKIAVYDIINSTSESRVKENKPAPFPVSVNTMTKTISANPNVMPYLETYLAAGTSKPIRTSWLNKVTRKLAQLNWYQNLASPLTRILVIWPGDRKEQVIDNFGDILHWSKDEREKFSELVTSQSPELKEGSFFPGSYVVDVGATPDTVAILVNERFNTEILSRYSPEVAAQVPLKDALTIASLLEREAYSFDDMQTVSGVIWNRLFAGIPLQLDATLQYAKGDAPTSALWWPPVKPADKFIDSPYNTYQNKGLPPYPIANPSAASLLAALNPEVTDCMFYFHDIDGDMYCSVTYEEHVEKLKELYGRGK